MLRLIDNILRASDVNKAKVANAITLEASSLAKWTVPILSIGTGIAAIVAGARERAACSGCLSSCTALYNSALCEDDSFGDNLACFVGAQRGVGGMAAWRVCLFVSLFWPISVLSKIVVSIATTLIRMCVVGNMVQFFVFGTHRQCIAFVRACIWLGLWFPLGARARDWADHAEHWNRLGGEQVWMTDFQDVHFYVWRFLLIYVLFTLCSFLAAISGRALSLTFHSEDHFDKIKTYMENETVIQMLTRPCRVPARVELDMQDGGELVLSGYDCAHWAALLFVTQVAEGHTTLDDNDDPGAHDGMVTLAHSMQFTLSAVIARRYVPPQFMSDAGVDSPPTRRAPSTGGEERTRECTLSMSTGMDDERMSEVVERVIECARESIALLGVRRRTHRSKQMARSQSSDSTMSSSSMGSMNPSDRGCRQKVSDAFERAFDHRASQAHDESDCVRADSHRQRIVRWLKHTWARCMRTLGIKGGAIDQDPTLLNGGIHDLRRYIFKSSRTLNRFDPDDGQDCDDDELTGRGVDAGEGESLGDDVMLGPGAQVHTWKLGYYLFWNLRNPRRPLPELSRADVDAVAQRIEMPAQSAWMLMDHNGDRRVTMDEVVRSVERVYNNRTILARSLSESQTVVGQVQNVIYAFLVIVLAFVAVAIVIPGSISKVWTSMSAGLLSFSFIFGNSIQQVFENCVFLFFTHPFDLGDKIRWGGDTYFVRGITLNYVNLLHASGSYVNLSTHVLKDAAITNVTRSQRVWESIHFVADINTNVRQCEIAADKVVEAITMHPRLFGGMYRVWLSDTDSANKIKISAHFDLKTNGMDASMMGEAMTVMTAAFADGLCEAGVSYTDLALACPTCWPKRANQGGENGIGVDEISAPSNSYGRKSMSAA
jgi:small-conductance mechanosensitive channel